MTTVASSVLPVEWTFAEVVEHLGGVPLRRVRAVPPPGTATEQDVLPATSRTGHSCELIDGMLVEKTMGYFESSVAVVLIRLLGDFVEKHHLGIVLGEGGTLKILPGQVRIPDVCVIRWERFPGRQLPREPIPAVAPDLAVEVLSEGNTPGEMQRKLRDYFSACVRLVWYLDPRARRMQVYASPEQCIEIDEHGTVDGGAVLPGFNLAIKDIFAA